MFLSNQSLNSKLDQSDDDRDDEVDDDAGTVASNSDKRLYNIVAHFVVESIEVC